MPSGRELAHSAIWTNQVFNKARYDYVEQLWHVYKRSAYIFTTWTVGHTGKTSIYVTQCQHNDGLHLEPFWYHLRLHGVEQLHVHQCTFTNIHVILWGRISTSNSSMICTVLENDIGVAYVHSGKWMYLHHTCVHVHQNLFSCFHVTC